MRLKISRAGRPQQPQCHVLPVDCNAPTVARNRRRSTVWTLMDGTMLIRMAIALLWLWGSSPAAMAQNRVTSEGWEGFATRTPEDKLERCVLYNRTIAGLNSSPYEMLGLTRDPAGNVGLMIFYRPRTLTRSERIGLTLKIDDHEPIALTGEVPSDFHVAS